MEIKLVKIANKVEGFPSDLYIDWGLYVKGGGHVRHIKLRNSEGEVINKPNNSIVSNKIVFEDDVLNNIKIKMFNTNDPEKSVDNELTGSRVNYYLCDVNRPLREGNEPYLAECEDIINALGMTWSEANMFKEIWRTASQRKFGVGKKNHTPLYGAEKIMLYAESNLKLVKGDIEDAEKD